LRAILLFLLLKSRVPVPERIGELGAPRQGRETPGAPEWFALADRATFTFVHIGDEGRPRAIPSQPTIRPDEAKRNLG
jgi:hypothetical protein